MSYTTPKYGLVVPSPTTRVNRLGLELQQMGISIDDVLASFDYDGADPNLVLSRVAALEAAVQAIQNWDLTVQSGITESFTLPAGSAAGVYVTFPEPFDALPQVTVAQGSPGTNNISVDARSVTSSSFYAYARNFTSGTSYSATIRWTARSQ